MVLPLVAGAGVDSGCRWSWSSCSRGRSCGSPGSPECCPGDTGPGYSLETKFHPVIKFCGKRMTVSVIDLARFLKKDHPVIGGLSRL